jgi:hypothetical protein
VRPAGTCCRAIDGWRLGLRRLACQRRFGVNDGGEEFRLHETVDLLQTLALPAIYAGRAALVVEKHLQISSQFVHDRESIVGRGGRSINYIES